MWYKIFAVGLTTGSRYLLFWIKKKNDIGRRERSTNARLHSIRAP